MNKMIDTLIIKSIEIEKDEEELNTNDYEIINSINYYTFIDTINNFENKIDNFFIKNKEYERLIYYNLNNWLLFLIESFKNNIDKKNNIWEQYIKDANRSIIYINNKKLYYSKNINNYINIYETTFQYYILIILSQIIFVIPYCLLQNNFYNKNYILSELSDIDLKRKNYSKKLIYNCLFTKNNTNIKINKYLRIFNFSNNKDETICIVHIFIEFNLINNKYSIIKFKFIPIF